MFGSDNWREKLEKRQRQGGFETLYHFIPMDWAGLGWDGLSCVVILECLGQKGQVKTSRYETRNDVHVLQRCSDCQLSQSM